MLKVSFKEDSKKVQVFNDRATIVTMVGQLMLPNALWAIVPCEVSGWIWQHPSVDASWGVGTKEHEVIRLEFSGKAVCAEGDIFNAKTGEHIAESRAKVKLYKFMENLCEKLMRHFYNVIWGNAEVGFSESHTENPKDCLYIDRYKYMQLWIKESHHLGKLLEEA